MKKFVAIDATLSTFSGARTYINGFLSYVIKSNPKHMFFILYADASMLDSKLLSSLRQSSHQIRIVNVPHKGPRLFLWRTLIFQLSLIRNKVDIAFYPSSFQFPHLTKYIALSQNIAPFHPSRNSFGWPRIRILKNRFLRLAMSFFYIQASSLIFLNQNAKETITKSIPGFPKKKKVHIIPHGQDCPKDVPANHLSPPYNLIYVSTLDSYKNHDVVISAVSALRRKYKLDIQLNLVGESTSWTLDQLSPLLAKGSQEGWLTYHGVLSRNKLFDLYKNTHLGIFASSCENMPIALNELISFGIPTIHSNVEPMLSMYGNSGLSFDPRSELNLMASIYRLIGDKHLYEIEAQRLRTLSSNLPNWDEIFSRTLAAIYSAI